MSNTYKPVSERAKALYGEDDFEADLTEVDERDQIDGGHLEVVPRAYRVLSDNFAGGEQDSVVDLALTIGREATLLGHHLERFEGEKPKKAAKKAASSS